MRLPGDGMSWKEFFVALKNETTDDQLTDLAAGVTYYGVLALFPFILFLVALASLVITPQQAEQVVQQLAQVAPGAVTQLVGDRIRQLAQQQNVGLATFGALGALWAASGATSAVMRALNTTYDVREGRPYWKTQGLSLLMTVVSSLMALAAALVAVAASPLADAIGGPIGTAITWLRLPVAGLIMMLLWALLYYALPDVEQDFKFITPGSVIGVVLWVVASWAFGFYVSHFGSYDKTYGSIAAVIILVFWMWISSVVMLLGAEINTIIEHRSPEGKREGAKSLADTGTTPAPGSARGGPQARAARQANARSGGAGWNGRERRTPALRAGDGRGGVAGVAAVVAGFTAGLLLFRRQRA